MLLLRNWVSESNTANKAGCLAVEAGVPVLPVAIWGKARLFGRIYVRFGDVINLPPETEDNKYQKQDYLRMSQEILDGIYYMMEVPDNGNHSS